MAVQEVIIGYRNPDDVFSTDSPVYKYVVSDLTYMYCKLLFLVLLF